MRPVSEPSSPEPDPVPPAAARSSSEPRIGDADRDRAVGYLQEHLAQGRLDAGEFDERMGRALRARTTSELAPLFSDLPQPKPGQELVPAAGFTAPPWQAGHAVAPSGPTAPSPLPASQPEQPRALIAVGGVIWPITVLAITFIPWLGWGNFWWLMFIPMIVSSVMGGNYHHRERERYRIEREQRRLDQRRRALGD
jgi:hypothetical protein